MSPNGHESTPAVPLSVTIDGEIYVRGRSLAGELMGSLSFTEMLLLELKGTPPTAAEVRMIDMILVALAEHGITPSSLTTRMVLDGAPESLSGAIAAGLLATGSRFLGTIEDAAHLLARVAGGGGTAAAAETEVRALVDAGRRIPGLGHNLHADVDPRVALLRAQAETDGIAALHVHSVDAVAATAASIRGDALIVNAAGMIAAILCDLGYAPEHVRGFALVARCGGLFAHVVDEQRAPIARKVWEQAHHDAAETVAGAGPQE